MYNAVVIFDNNYLHYSVYVSGVCAGAYAGVRKVSKDRRVQCLYFKV